MTKFSALIIFLLALPLSHGQDLLFLGPGFSKESEVFTFASENNQLSTATCSVPIFPTIWFIWGSTAFLHEGFLHICGGNSFGFQSKCYKLKSGAWTATTEMTGN